MSWSESRRDTSSSSSPTNRALAQARFVAAHEPAGIHLTTIAELSDAPEPVAAALVSDLSASDAHRLVDRGRRSGARTHREHLGRLELRGAGPPVPTQR